MEAEETEKARQDALVVSSFDPIIVHLEKEICEIRGEQQVFRESIIEHKVGNENVQNMLQLILQKISASAPAPEHQALRIYFPFSLNHREFTVSFVFLFLSDVFHSVG